MKNEKIGDSPADFQFLNRKKKLNKNNFFHPFTVSCFVSFVFRFGFEGNEAFEAIVDMKLIMSVPNVIIKKK